MRSKRKEVGNYFYSCPECSCFDQTGAVWCLVRTIPRTSHPRREVIRQSQEAERFRRSQEGYTETNRNMTQSRATRSAPTIESLPQGRAQKRQCALQCRLSHDEIERRPRPAPSSTAPFAASRQFGAIPARTISTEPTPARDRQEPSEVGLAVADNLPPAPMWRRCSPSRNVWVRCSSTMSDELWDDLPDVGVGHSAAVGELRSALHSATSLIASVPATPDSIPCEA